MERLVEYGYRCQRGAGDSHTHRDSDTDVGSHADARAVSYANSDTDAYGIIVAGAVQRIVSC